MLSVLAFLYSFLGTYQLDSIRALPDSLFEAKMDVHDRLIITNTDTALAAKTMMALGEQYHALNRQDQSLEQFTRALDAYKNIADSIGICRALGQISKVYSCLEAYEMALNYAQKVPAYTHDMELLKGNNHQIGCLFLNLREYDSAEKYLKIAVEQHRGLGSIATEPLLTLAGLYIDRGEFDQALQQISELEKIGGSNSSMAFCYFQGALYHQLEESRPAGSADSEREGGEALAKLQQFLSAYVASDSLDLSTADHDRDIRELKEFYQNDLSSQLENFQKQYELQEKEIHIQLLEKENQLYEMSQKESRLYLFFLVLGVVVLLLTLMLSYRLLVLGKKRNKELNVLNKRISDQSNDLKSKNRLLHQTIKELVGTQSQLIQSEKMASIGSFVSGVAHELNNPVNVLTGGFQVIQRSLGEMSFDDIKYQDLVTDINVMIKESNISIAKINRIIQALIIATYTDKHPVEVEFLEIIDNVKLAFREESSNESIRFTQEVEFVMFKCFPNRIHHAIKAILENAFYYARKAVDGEAFVRLEARKVENVLVVHIENNGSCISEENLLKIFDPFFSTKDDGDSPGLGLYFAYSAVIEHQGSIAATNENGNVRFTMRFPL